MDISMDIHAKSVDMDMDMDMDGKFQIHGDPANISRCCTTCCSRNPQRIEVVELGRLTAAICSHR